MAKPQECTLVSSRYNIFVPLTEERVLAYNARSGSLAVWENTDREIFHRATTKAINWSDDRRLVEPFVYGGFLVFNDLDELEVLREEYVSSRFDPSIMILTIAPTLACNFGCDYCFQGPNKPAGSMGVRVQDAIVKFVDQAQHVKRLQIAWYGGEPLLAMPVIESLSDRLLAVCASRNVVYNAMVVTNGYKLDRKCSESLVQRRVTSAQVTLDGAEEDHDRSRPLINGRSSYSRIIRNLTKIVNEEPSLNISLRVNVDQRNGPNIYRLLDELDQLGLGRRKNFGVYFAPVEAITDGCHSSSGSCLSKAEYGELELDLVRRAFDAGLCSAPYPPRFRGLCGALRPQGIVVLPNGDLHKCWDTVSMPEMKVGQIWDTDAVRDDPRAQRWLEWSPFDNPVCSKCKILPNCVGSCAHKFLNPGQTKGEAASLPCPSWKYNIYEKLVFQAEKAGVIDSRDYRVDDIRTDLTAICPVRPEAFEDLLSESLVDDLQVGCGTSASVSISPRPIGLRRRVSANAE